MTLVPQASEPNQKVDLSIIIVNFNTRRLLQQCLQSIYNATGGLGIEVFVVDNASSDDSVEMIRSQFLQVRLITNSKDLGFSRAANLALAEGQGDYFLVAHPDITFMSDTIREMLSFLATHPQVGIVGGNFLYPDGSYNDCLIKRLSIRQEIAEFVYYSFRRIVGWFPWIYERLKEQRDLFYWDHQTTAESEVIWSACMMFKREVLETIGSFCEEFFVWFTDFDWCYRATDAGWKACYLLEARVIHYEQKSHNYLDDELVSYKVDGFLVRNPENADRYTLLQRHHSLFFLWLSKVIDTLSLWRTLLRRTLLRK